MPPPSVFAVYRTQLKAANDLNWERFKAELRAGLAEVRSELHTEIASVRKDMGDFKSELLKWMFVYWTGTIVTLGGLIIALSRPH